MTSDINSVLAVSWARFISQTAEGHPIVMLQGPIVLTEAELIALTGYKQRGPQLKELHRQGFHRARLGRLGGLILERAHYEAVCGGHEERARPKVKPPISSAKPNWKVALNGERG
jgi:Domain of unknown function (DUF4224)